MIRLPLYGPARAVGPRGLLPLRRKALALLYYLALEGPSRREKLASLLWDHGSAGQNLRSELAHLRRFFGKEAFRGPVLELPPGVELDPTPAGGEVMEGLEGLSPAFQEWLSLKRVRLGRGGEALSFPERLRQIKPPALLVLIGPPGSGREGLARALADRLRLPFREHPGPGPGVFYFSSPLPPPEEALALKPLPGQVLVVARSAFGEDPDFLLALRGRFPPELTTVYRVDRLSWPEARERLLRPLAFGAAARFYLESGGRVGILRELLAMGSPEALPQRIRAQVLLEARRLSPGGQRALVLLALHPGSLTEKAAACLGVGPALDELEHHGWLVFQGGRYRWTEPQFRPYLAKELAPGERLRLHRLLADCFQEVGDPVAEAFHRHQAGEEASLPSGGWRAVLEGVKVASPVARRSVGLGLPRLLDSPEEVVLVSFGGEPVEHTFFLEEEVVLHLSGSVYQELPLGLGVEEGALPLFLEGEGVAYFLPVAEALACAQGVCLPENPLDHLLYLPPGFYRLGLGTKGLAEVRLRAYQPRTGDTPVLSPLGVLKRRA